MEVDEEKNNEMSDDTEDSSDSSDADSADHSDAEEDDVDEAEAEKRVAMLQKAVVYDTGIIAHCATYGELSKNHLYSISSANSR